MLQLELPKVVVATTAPSQPRRWLWATRRQQLEPCWAWGGAPKHSVLRGGSKVGPRLCGVGACSGGTSPGLLGRRGAWRPRTAEDAPPGRLPGVVAPEPGQGLVCCPQTSAQPCGHELWHPRQCIPAPVITQISQTLLHHRLEARGEPGLQVPGVSTPGREEMPAIVCLYSRFSKEKAKKPVSHLPDTQRLSLKRGWLEIFMIMR